MRTTYLAEDLRYDSKKIEPVIESLKAKHIHLLENEKKEYPNKLFSNYYEILSFKFWDGWLLHGYYYDDIKEILRALAPYLNGSIYWYYEDRLLVRWVFSKGKMTIKTRSLKGMRWNEYAELD